jgi:hypothetical protein
MNPKSHKKLWTYWLQRNTTEHSSTRYCISLYRICWMHLYEWDYKKYLWKQLSNLGLCCQNVCISLYNICRLFTALRMWTGLYVKKLSCQVHKMRFPPLQTDATWQFEALDISHVCIQYRITFHSLCYFSNSWNIAVGALVGLWTGLVQNFMQVFRASCNVPSNTKIIQRLQSKVLRTITNAPWYVSNYTLHNDLQILFITEEIKRYSTVYYNPLIGHENSYVT